METPNQEHGKTTDDRDWRELAEAFGIPISVVERKAKAGYYANWKELPNKRGYPPAWESTSDEVRDWVRKRTVCTLIA